MTVIFVTPLNQRIGDLAAGTHVVRDRHGDRHGGRSPAPPPPVDLGTAATWDVSAVSGEDVAAVRAFLERRESLQPEARARIAAELCSRLRPRVGGASESMANEHFLQYLVAAKAARS